MKSTISRKLALSAMALAATVAATSSPLHANTLIGWDIMGKAGDAALAPTTSDANTVGGSLTLAGTHTAGTATNAWGATGFNGTSASESSAIAANDFASFTITANTGFTMSLSDIAAYNIRRSGTGPSTGIWQYQIGTGAFTDIGSPIVWGTGTTSTGNAQTAVSLLGIAALQNIAAGTTITFRVVDWGGASGGSWYINNFQTGNDLALEGNLQALSAALLWTGGNNAWDQTTPTFQNAAPNDTVWNNTNNASTITANFNTPSAITLDAAGISANGLNFLAGSDTASISGPGALTIGAQGLTATTNTTVTINAKISGTSGLTMQGAGTVILTNTANDFSGPVTLGGGKLSIASDLELGNAANAIVLAGGALQTTANYNTARSISGTGSLNIAPGTTFVSTGTFATTSLSLSAGGNLDLQGPAPSLGLLLLPATASFAVGSTTGLQVNLLGIDASALNGTVTLASAGGIKFGTTGTRTINVGPNGDVVIPSPVVLFGIGNNSLAKSGAGILELDADNTGDGVSTGLLRLQIGNASATAPTLGGTVIIGNKNALGTNQVFLNNGTISANTNLTGASAIPIGISIGALDNGPAIFAGNNMEFQGETDLFEIAAAQNHITVNNTTTFSGAFASGSGAVGSGLTIDGTGTAVFSGSAAAMARTTTVSGTATMVVNNQWGTAGAGAIVVSAGGTLRGSGAINAPVTVNAGGLIDPGTSTTTLTVNSSLSLAGTAQFLIDATNPGLNAAGKISGISSLTFGGNLKIVLTSGSLADGQSWDLLDFTNGNAAFANNAVFGTDGAGSLLPTLPAGEKWFFDYSTGILSVATSGVISPLSLLWTGGNAAWDQSALRWHNLADNDTAWNNSADATVTSAVFNTPNAIAIDAGNISADSLSFQAGADGIVLAGPGILTLHSAAISIDPTVTATIGAQLSGTAGLTVQGGGTLVLTNSTNDFSGTVAVNAGALAINADSVLGNAANAVVLAGGTLKATASFSSARSFTGSGSIDVAPGQTLALTGTVNFPALNISNTGTLDLQHASTIGALTFTAGGTLTSTTSQQLVVTTISATNLTGTAVISGTAGLLLPTGTKTIDVGPAGDLVLATPVTSAGASTQALKKTGAGTLELNAANTALWRVQIGSASPTAPVDGGVVKFNNRQSLGLNQLFLNFGTLQATADVTGTNAIPIGLSISGRDNGVTVLAGNNMEFQGDSALFQPAAATSRLTVNNTTILSSTSATAFGSGTGTATGFTLDGTGTLMINGDAHTMTLATTLQGSVSLVVNNLWNAPITLTGGTLGGAGKLSGNVIGGVGAHTIAPSAGLVGNTATNLTLGGLTTSSDTTLAFNLATPGASSVNDKITVTSANGLTLSGGHVAITHTTTGVPSLGYYKAIAYNGTLGGTLGSITMPTVVNNVSYVLDSAHDAGFIDIHRGFLGDANDDGTVNFDDFLILSQNFGQAGGWSKANFISDPTVDFNDFLVLSQYFGQSIGLSDSVATPAELAQFQAASASFFAGTGVPEPTSLALLGIGAAALLTRRRRQA